MKVNYNTSKKERTKEKPPGIHSASQTGDILHNNVTVSRSEICFDTFLWLCVYIISLKLWPAKSVSLHVSQRNNILHTLQILLQMHSFSFLLCVYYSKDNETRSSVWRRPGKLSLRGFSSPETYSKETLHQNLQKSAYIDCISVK